MPAATLSAMSSPPCLLTLCLGLGLGYGAPALVTRLRGPLNSFTRGSALKLR